MDVVQADLKIRLLANDVIVAESSDPRLWQRVLSAVVGGGQLPKDGDRVLDEEDHRRDSAEPSDTPVGALASKLEISEAELRGALAPEDSAPYIHLDARTWEAFRNNFPSRGSNAVAAVVLAATALVLWFEELGLEGPSSAQAQAVLGTINVTGKNPSRSIRNCDWLQSRNGRIHLNPAHTSQAYAVIRAFCRRQGPPGSS